VLDAFHVMKLANAVVDDVRRRVQQETTGHRGRRDDPLYCVRNISARVRSTSATASRPGCAPRSPPARNMSRSRSPTAAPGRSAPASTRTPTRPGRRLAETVLTSLPTCPIPQVARLGRTLKQWREAFLGYFDTNRASNGGTEAVNGLISSTGRARGFRNREVKDFWQHRTRFVVNTRWWPPFCATTDWVAAAILAAAIAIGADLG